MPVAPRSACVTVRCREGDRTSGGAAGSGEDRAQEAALVAAYAAGLPGVAEDLLALCVGAGCRPVGLVHGQRRERQQRERLVAVAFARHEVAVMGSAQLRDQTDPFPAVVRDLFEL